VKIYTIECDKCGSHDVRLARYNGFMERAKGFFGIQPFRCRDCKHRFVVTIWLLDKIAYAKCPKCLRMKLVYWSKKHYRPGAFTGFLISMGAQRYRCASCRCNFVSFRPRKQYDKEEAEPQEEVLPPEAAAATPAADSQQATDQQSSFSIIEKAELPH
jgi:transposase-like protein